MDGTKLLTYAELGAALGISAASAKRLAIRRRWPKQPGNDGKARVMVPVERLQVEPKKPAGDGASARPDEHAGDGTGDVTGAVIALTQHIQHLAKELSDAQAALDEERARAVGLQIEAALVPSLRTTIDALKSALDERSTALRELRARRWWQWRTR